MAKKDITTILKNGSAKQRILLFAEDVARHQYFKDPLLTPAEAKVLEDSFKTSAEIQLWNKFKALDRIIITAIQNLQGLTFEIMMHKSDLRGYILLWNAIETSEQLTNSILHEIKDVEERKRIVKAGIKSSASIDTHLVLSKTTIDEEGYLDLKVDFESDSYDKKSKKIKMSKKLSLINTIEQVSKTLTDTVSDYKGCSQSVYDYMKETGFNIKTYKETLEKFDQNVYSEVIGWQKYLSSFNSFGLNDTFFSSQNKSRIMDKLKPYYSVCPNLLDVPMNKERYGWYRKTFLEED